MGVDDPGELRKHIIQIQDKTVKVSQCSLCWLGVPTQGSDVAFRVQDYYHILAFVRSGFARMPTYPHVFELAKNQPDAIFLDTGCCREDQLILGVCLGS